MGFVRRVRSWFGDPALLFAVVGLSLFGVAMIYSAGQLDVPDPAVANIWKMQLFYLVVSIVALFIMMRIEVRWLEWAAVPAYVIGLITLLVTLVIGTGAGTAAGTRSWLQFGPVRVQPAQFANLATILMLARVMGGWRETPRSLIALWKPVLIVAIPMLLVFAQPDLGTAMVFGGIMIATLYWGGTPPGLLLLLLSPMIGLFLAFIPWLFSLYMVGLLLFL